MPSPDSWQQPQQQRPLEDRDVNTGRHPFQSWGGRRVILESLQQERGRHLGEAGPGTG